MTKQTIIFGNPDPKKHSVRYKAQSVTGDAEPAITDIYVKKVFLGKDVPAKVEVTVEYLNDLD